MPRKISFSPTRARRSLISSIRTPDSTRLLQTPDQPSLQSVPIGNIADRGSSEELRKDLLSLFPDRFLCANRAIGTIIGALLETIHQHKRPFHRLIDVLDTNASGKLG